MEGNMTEAVLATAGTIAKVDDDERLVFGWAYIAKRGEKIIVDREGDFIEDPEVLAKSAYNFMLKSRQSDVMHTQIPVADMVESIVFTPDKIAKMGLPNDFPVGWWVGFKVKDESIWKLVKNGDLSMFSIGGRGGRIAV